MVSKPSNGKTQGAPRGGGLSRFVDAPDGITREQAEQRAALNVEFMRKEAMAELDAALGRVGALLATTAADPTVRPYGALKTDAHGLHSFSGTFGFGPLGVAAFMLREYTQLLESQRRWDQTGLTLFYDSMRCLRGSMSAVESAQVLAALKQLSQHTLVNAQKVEG